MNPFLNYPLHFLIKKSFICSHILNNVLLDNPLIVSGDPFFIFAIKLKFLIQYHIAF